MEQINKRREQIFNYYYKALIPLVNDGKLRLPYISSECQTNSHLFYIILKDESTRNPLIDHLRSMGIQALFHYLPLHFSEIGRSMAYKDGQLPMTESLSSRLLRLPFYYDMRRGDQGEVVAGIQDFFQKNLSKMDDRPKTETAEVITSQTG